MSDTPDMEHQERRATEDTEEQTKQSADTSDGQTMTEETKTTDQQGLDELEQERIRSAELLDQAQRARAELINYRRRMEQEMQQVRLHAGERIISRLLPVVDDFHRAVTSVPENERESPWIQGILLIERKLWTILESEGVRPIESVGKPFDPSIHEAVTVEGDGAADTVVEEFQRGYTLHDRIIRPAMVKVGPAPTQS